MSDLQVRFLSAVAAIALIGGAYFVKGVNGILAISLVVVLMGAWEFGRMSIKPLYKSRKIMLLYMTICSLLLPIFSFASGLILPTFAASICLFFTGSLWLSRERIKIDKLQNLLAVSALGFLYCTLFPSFAFKILLGDKGIQIFLTFLSVVFAGDVFAYFFGKFFGKTRLMPALSPKKTVEGAVGGAFGSIVIALIANEIFTLEWTPFFTAISAVLTGVVAQTGDLFESLLKRNAGVKDSGRIMPGHGGVLDRLDGVYFGAPVFYCCLAYQQTLTPFF